jgi:hypothetical protein
MGEGYAETRQRASKRNPYEGVGPAVELTLLGTVAVAVFLLGGAVVMLVSAFRRTIELRRALIEAMARIENLEAALVAGKPLNVTVTAFHAEAIASIAEGAPRLLEAPPRVAEIAAQVDASDRIEPPHIGVLALGALLAATAALAASSVRTLSGQGGVVLSLLIGLAVIATAEWRRRADAGNLESNQSKLNQPIWIALLGLVIGFAAIMVGRWTLGSVHPPTAVLGVSLLALGALALAARYGLQLMAPALLFASAAPAMSAIQAPGAWGQYAFLALFTAAVFSLARRRAAPIWAWLALAPALFWGVNIAMIGGVDFNVGVGGLYLAALAGLGLLYAGPSAPALPFPRFWSAPWTAPMLLGALLTGSAAAAFTALLARHPADASHAGAALLIFTIILAGGGAVRPGLWPTLPLALAANTAIVALWPLPDIDYTDAVGISAGAAALLALAGLVALSQSDDRRPGAWLAAFAPVSLFAAFYIRVEAWDQHFAWSLGAAALLAVNLFAALRFQNVRAVCAAFVGGAAVSGACLAAMLPAAQQAFVLAAALPALALIHRWRPNLGLRIAALVIVAVLALVLINPRAQPWLIVWSVFALCGAATAYFYGRLPPRPARPKTVAEPKPAAHEPTPQPEMHS